jgi:hypothetical protein
MWFETLMGFEEKSPAQVRENIIVEGEYLISKINNKKYKCGKLEVSTLENLRSQDPALDQYDGQLILSEKIGNISILHQDKINNGSVFQAASQFNLLEMVGPQVTPEDGVGIYEHDRTQGPACAIACGAGTIYRNYFAEVNGEIGQSRKSQIDCLDELGKYFGNEKESLWKMKNGYALTNRQGLSKLTQKIKMLSETEYQIAKGKLKVGTQKDTQVTISENGHHVTQVYCSALPIAYSAIEYVKWESIARLILDATYEATFQVAVQNFQLTGNKNLYLTLVGGGAFGNPLEWILDSIKKSVAKFAHIPLNVMIVSYRSSNPTIAEFISTLRNN